MHEELTSWTDIRQHAVRILNTSDRVVFSTPEEQRKFRDMIEEATKNGYRIVTIPEKLKHLIQEQRDLNGLPIRDLNRFYEEYNDSFELKFVDPDKLTKDERKVLYMTEDIFRLIGGRPSQIREIKISETMRKERTPFMEALGLWQPKRQRIIIKRSQLQSFEHYAGTLLHEAAHALSEADDVSLEFELQLTHLLGKVASQCLTKGSHDTHGYVIRSSSGDGSILNRDITDKETTASSDSWYSFLHPLIGLLRRVQKP